MGPWAAILVIMWYWNCGCTVVVEGEMPVWPGEWGWPGWWTTIYLVFLQVWCYDGPSGPKRIPITRGESHCTQVSCVAQGSWLNLGRFPAFPQLNQSWGGLYRQFLQYLGAVLRGYPQFSVGWSAGGIIWACDSITLQSFPTTDIEDHWWHPVIICTQHLLMSACSM